MLGEPHKECGSPSLICDLNKNKLFFFGPEGL